ncbi:MAG: putative ABC transporter permease [Oscillospiraceae bacterium]|nr:putative ABC transporter permease [Oscillospiraceae bacterium]
MELFGKPKAKHHILKQLFLFWFGGATYASIEVIFRGHSHWSMILLGGCCFICLGEINKIVPWKTPLTLQMLLGSIVITSLEFITGCIVNLELGLDVWDYSDMPLNLLGQICLPFSIIWFFFSALGILLFDYLDYWFFGGEKPRYRLF